MSTVAGKRSNNIIFCLLIVLVFTLEGLFLLSGTAYAATTVHLSNGQSYDISKAGKKTIVEIDDATASGSGGTGTVELKGSSSYVWIHISLSEGKTVYVNLADGLSIQPGKKSAHGIGKALDTLGHSRAGIYIDETNKAGGTVVLRSEPGATVRVNSYDAGWPYGVVPAIMKNNTKTKLIFDTVDKSKPGTIIAQPTSGTGAVGIGAFGKGVFGVATSRYTVGNISFDGGNVKAYGNNYGAGIGAYDYSNVGELYFNGAHVEAYAGNSNYKNDMCGSAGIGTGYRGNIGRISITGGYVEAWGRGTGFDPKGRSLLRILGTCGCGIGGGWYDSHIGEIAISGGTVVAHGGSCSRADGEYVAGSGIGTTVLVGKRAPVCTADQITITGGDITAVGGTYTCGIGGCVKNILIAPATPETKLKIHASIEDGYDRAGKQFSQGSGIGTANNVSERNRRDYPGNITIKGGDITAEAGRIGDSFDQRRYCGAGIGPTSQARVGTISISGGTINALGGWNAPGIGGPNGCADTDLQTVDNIHISGGTITATKASYNGKGTALSGIGGFKIGNKLKTDIRITGGSVISNGSEYAIGYDKQPENDKGDFVYGTKFKFDPDIGEWTRIDQFRFDPALSYDYGLNDVYTKKGLDDDSDDNIVEFWIPTSADSSKYACVAKTADRNYKTIDPTKIEAGDTTTLKPYTDITYVNEITGEKYHGTGVYGEDKLTIQPAPKAMQRFRLLGYGVKKEGRWHKVANGGFNDVELPLLQSTEYVDSNGKWKVCDGALTLYMMLERTHYLVKYDKNQPDTASHKVAGTMADSEFPTSGSSTLPENQFSLTGWEFVGWNTKPDGTGTPYSDEGGITFASGDTLTLYAQWVPKKYTVAYDPGAAPYTQPYRQQNLEYDKTYKLVKIADIGWTMEGNRFHGWNGAGFGSFYEDGEEFHNLCTLDDNGDPVGKTLTADWIGEGNIKVTTTVDGTLTDVTDKMAITGVGATATIKEYLTDDGSGHYEASLSGLPEGEYQLVIEDDPYYVPQEKQDLGVLRETTAVSRVLDYYTVTMHNEDHAQGAYVKEEGTSDPHETMEVPDDAYVIIGAGAEPGYHFDGYSYYGVEPEWRYSPTAANQGIVVRGKTDITAHGEANVYHIKYDQNKPDNASHEVKGSMNTQDFIFDEPQDLWENDYSLTGWTFAGWNTKKDGNGESFSDKATIDTGSWENLEYPDNDANVTLYAQWKPNKYEVLFSATDATSGEMDPQEFTYDTAQALAANAFERTDWHFMGWNTEPAGVGKAYEDGEEVKNLTTGKSITLYAQWEHDYYTVTFDKNDTQAAGEMPDEQIWTNSAFELPLCSYEKTGYHLESWNTKADGSGTRYEDGGALENAAAKGESLTLYAQWAPNAYTVKYDANTGKGTMPDQRFTYDEPQDLTANAFRKAHYIFTGWNTAKDGSGTAYANQANVINLTVYQNDTVTLYAQWEKAKYTISYDLNGGTYKGKTGTVEMTCTYGDVITLPKPERKGYTFDYWKGSRYHAGDKYTVGEDHTFTAQWKENGGTDTGDDMNLLFWLILLTAAAAVGLGTFMWKIKEER